MRPIDADRLADGLTLHRQSTDQNHETDRQWAVGYNAGLDRALYSIAYAPTLTQPNEAMTLEMVAEILAEQFGDECACNFNGNDEWLPEVCQHENTCPNPPERLGCWMELLRHKYRRPPGGR